MIADCSECVGAIDPELAADARCALTVCATRLTNALTLDFRAEWTRMRYPLLTVGQLIARDIDEAHGIGDVALIEGLLLAVQRTPPPR